MEPFRVEGRPGHVTVSGEVDMEAAPSLRHALDAASRAGEQVIVDLTGVSFIDSSGINELLRPVNQGCRVVIAGASATVQRTFRLVGLDEVLDITDSSGPALPRSS